MRTSIPYIEVVEQNSNKSLEQATNTVVTKQTISLNCEFSEALWKDFRTTRRDKVVRNP